MVAHKLRSDAPYRPQVDATLTRFTTKVKKFEHWLQNSCRSNGHMSQTQFKRLHFTIDHLSAKCQTTLGVLFSFFLFNL